MRRVLTILAIAFLLWTWFVLMVRFVTVLRIFNFHFLPALPYMFSPQWESLQGTPRQHIYFRQCLTTCTIFALIILVSCAVSCITLRFRQYAAPWRYPALRVMIICFVLLVSTTTASLVTNSFDAGFQFPGVGSVGFSPTGLYLYSDDTNTRRAWIDRWDSPDSLEFWAYSYVDNQFTLRMPIWMLLLAILAPTITFYLASRRPLPGHCRCGYNLTGNTSGICPECGNAMETSIRP